MLNENAINPDWKAPQINDLVWYKEEHETADDILVVERVARVITKHSDNCIDVEVRGADGLYIAKNVFQGKYAGAWNWEIN